MAVWEILLIGVGLSMDAFAVGLTDGMTEPKMKWWKVILIAVLFGGFQFLMPVLGYYFGSIFASVVQKIAPWLSFAILAFLGGKMIFDFFMERKKRGQDAQNAEADGKSQRAAGIGKLLLQAVATAIDALAVGVTFVAAQTDKGLPFHAVLCALIIGAVTFLLSVAAVLIGRKAGDKFSDKAQLLGGVILIAIGLKILIEGLVG